MRIADRVWPAWREAVDQNPGEPVLMLLFSPDAGDPTAAVRGMREAIMEVWEVLQDEIWASENVERGAGEWRWLGVPEGVLIQVAECDVFGEMMRGVAAALERRGFDGVFDAREWPRGVDAPGMGHMLICRLRIRGRRRGFERGYDWEPDPDALAEIVAVAERWCKQLGQRASYALTKSTIGRVPVEFGEDAVEGLLEGPVDNVRCRLIGIAGDEFREVGVGPVGGMGLVVGGSDIEDGRWRPALEALIGLLRDNADLLVYGYVRRGWAGGLFTNPGDSSDWPPRPNSEPRGAGWTSQAFEDVFAPDAFAVQLVGPGYAGRVPQTPSYRHERAGPGVTLVEHVYLPAWFEAPFIPYGLRPGSGDMTPPPVLVEARKELTSILYTPGALNRAGYTDMPDV